MDEIGKVTFAAVADERHNFGQGYRIAHADPRIRIDREWFDLVRRSNVWGRHMALDGDVLTIRDDYGARFIYRIHWDDCTDGGYLAEWPD